MADNILSDNPFLEAAKEPDPYLSPFKRSVTRPLAYGATLGAVGNAPEDVTGHVAEFVGSVPTIMGLSALATPAVGAATRLTRLRPLGKLGTEIASNLAVDTAISGIESQTKDRSFAENLAWNVGGSAVGMGIFHGGAKLRPSATANNLDDLAKATTTKVPETPSISTTPGNVLKIDEPAGPSSATIGPNIGRNRNPIDPKRVHMTDYTELYDEYGRPINMAPETRLSATTTQVDEYGAPRQVQTQLSPEDYARQTAPQGVSLQASRASEMLNAVKPTTPVGESQFVAPTPDLGGTKPFKAQFDPRLNTFVITPQSQAADDAMHLLANLDSPRNVEMQLNGAQQVHMADPQAGIRKEIERLAKENEALRTSKLLGKSEEEVETIVQNAKPAKPIDVVSLKETKAGQTVDELILKHNIPQEKIISIVKEAELENAKQKFANEQQRLASLTMRILSAVRKECT